MRHMVARLGLVLLLIGTTGASSVEFTRRAIVVSSDPGYRLISHLEDIDNDGLTDLLVLVLLRREVQVYRQRPSGFLAAPDHTVPLPEGTAWISLRNIDPHPGKEIVFSTSTGIVYLRQDQGAFESSVRTLVEARQVFETDSPRILAASPNYGDANDVIPVTFSDRAVLYEKAGSGLWRPGRTFDLEATEAQWHVGSGSGWMMGPNPSRALSVEERFRAGRSDGQADEGQGREAEVRQLIDEIERKDPHWRRRRVERKDINSDGREDLILWHQQGDVRSKTIVLIFLRGQDDRLPERPTDVVRSNGLPFRINRDQGITPFYDLDGDGRCELILVMFKTRLTSWSGLVDMFLGGGVDWVFTARSGRNGTYSHGPDFQMDVTSNLPRESSLASLFQINGDFNADGRADLLVERAPEQFDVYLSSTTNGFFREKPALSFAAETEARKIETADLNGDGISDFFVQAWEKAHITIFLSQPDHQKGKDK